MEINEKMIIESVMKELLKKGLIENSSDEKHYKEECSNIISSKGEPITLEPVDKIGIENAINMEAIKEMRKTTPARILMGRCGTRQKTSYYLNFLADHAGAMDAVFKDVSDEFLEKNNLIKVQTIIENKDEYLMRPDRGKKISEEGKATILKNFEKGKQVQIIVVDGLSSTAIEANVEDTIPALIQGLQANGISVGKPFFVKYGRVGVEDEIGMLLDCDVVIELVGERPGLITAESMSSYMIYRPTKDTVEADRTVVSNIHSGGTPPAEAGAHMATIVKKMLENKASGMKLAALQK